MNKREKSKVVQPHSALFKKKKLFGTWQLILLPDWLLENQWERVTLTLCDIFVYKFYYFVYKQNNIWKWKFCITFQ